MEILHACRLNPSSLLFLLVLWSTTLSLTHQEALSTTNEFPTIVVSSQDSLSPSSSYSTISQTTPLLSLPSQAPYPPSTSPSSSDVISHSSSTSSFAPTLSTLLPSSSPTLTPSPTPSPTLYTAPLAHSASGELETTPSLHISQLSNSSPSYFHSSGASTTPAGENFPSTLFQTTADPTTSYPAISSSFSSSSSSHFLSSISSSFLSSPVSPSSSSSFFPSYSFSASVSSFSSFSSSSVSSSPSFSFTSSASSSSPSLSSSSSFVSSSSFLSSYSVSSTPSPSLSSSIISSSSIPSPSSSSFSSSPSSSSSSSSSIPSPSSSSSSSSSSFSSSSAIPSPSSSSSSSTSSSSSSSSSIAIVIEATSTVDTNSDVLENIRQFFNDHSSNPLFLAGVTLGPVILLLIIIICVLGCCCCFKMRKTRRKVNLHNPSVNGYPVYRSRSKSTAQAYDPDHIDLEDMTSFYDTYPSQSGHSQLQHSQIMCESPFNEPLPSISPLSYPSQLQKYLTASERVEGASATQPLRGTLSGSSSSSKIHPTMRQFPGSSLSLHHPTPLGQQLQKQAERSSTQGSRNSIQGSRASISALGASFSGSLFSNNTVSREEMQGLRSSEGEVTSLSLREDVPVMRKGSLDTVPTRDSPAEHQMMGRKAGKREFVSLTCIHNPHTTLQSDDEMREETKSEDENDLRKDPLLPIMTSTPAEVEQDAPIKGEKDARRGSTSLSPDSSIFTSPQRKAHVNLRELTSLSLDHGKEEGEGEEKKTTNDDTDKKESEEGVESIDEQKEEAVIPQDRERGMSRLEKLTSLNYIRSSIRRSLKKKRISFLTRTPDSTPKSKKKILSQDPELTPEPLTFSNQNAFDTEDPAQARIHTPSPLSPAFEGEDSHPQRYPEDAFHPEVYPETHHFHQAPYRAPGHRGRTFSDAPHYIPQLSQPTYYPSMPMHYPQPPYPQLSQQYVPQPYVPPPPQPMFLASPQHRGYGALMSPTHPYQDPYHRRFSDVNMMGAAGHHQGEPDSRGAGYFGPHRQNPEQYTHSSDGRTLSNSKPAEAFRDNSEPYRGQAQSPDRFTETSNVSDFRPPSPNMYEVMSERQRFMEGPQRFHDSPAEPDDLLSQGLYSPVSSAAPFTHGNQYRERSHDKPMRPHDISMRSHDNPMRLHDPGPPSFQSRLNQRRLSTDRVDFEPRTGVDFRPRNGMDFGPNSGMRPMDSEMYGGRMEMENPRIELGWHSNRNSRQYEEGADWMNNGMEDSQRTPNVESDNFSGNHHLNKPAAVNEPASSAKARVSWNNEIIEYARTPSECSSDHYDL